VTLAPIGALYQAWHVLILHEAMTTIPLPRRDSALWVAVLATIWMLVDTSAFGQAGHWADIAD